MSFITSLFGGEGNSFLTAIFALGVVIVAILLVLWLLKLLFNASGNVARGRNRRRPRHDEDGEDQGAGRWTPPHDSLEV